MRYLLGIDIGSTVCKAALYDVNGNEVAVAGHKTEVLSPQPGWREVQPEALWSSVEMAVNEVIIRTGIMPGDIAAVGTSGAGNGVYILDEDGKSIRPGIQSSDTRANGLVQGWYEKKIPDKTFPISYQPNFCGQAGACLAWIKKYEPENYRQIAHVMMVKDYITYRLTGKFCTDITDGSGASLLDLKTRKFSKDLLDLYGIPEVWTALPDLYQSYEVVGTVSQRGISTGLLVGTPVVAGLHDMAACAFGSGAINAGDTVCVVGTWAVNEMILNNPSDKLTYSENYVIPGSILAAIVSGFSALNLEWFVTNFFQEEKRNSEKTGKSVYETCNEIVESLTENSHSVIYHPFIMGGGLGNENAMAGFYGVTNQHTKADFLRAVYEGVVFHHLDSIEEYRGYGFSPEKIFLSGGGSRSKVWTQMFCDAFNLPISVASGSELGAHGAAMCAGIGAGVYSDCQDAVAKSIRIARQHSPNPVETKRLLALYKEYRQIGEAMSDSWIRLRKLGCTAG